MNFTELFRLKLENDEIVPDNSVRSKLMRNLSRREFLRFNPSRFNIYYVGGIVVAAIISAILLSSELKNSDQRNTVNIPDNKSKENKVIQDGPNDVKEPDTLNIRFPEPIKNKTAVSSKVKPHEETAQNIGSRINDSIIYTVVKGSSVKKGLFFESKTGNKKLKEKNIQDKIFFEISATEGCTPLKLYFYYKSAPFDSCRWTFGDGGYSDEKNPEWIYDVAGEYKVVLNVYGSGSMQTTSSSIITVYPKPVARFEITSDKALLAENEIEVFNYSTNAINFKWDFGDGSTSEIFEPKHSYGKYGNYNVRLVVSSEYGCSDSLIIMNALSGSEYFIDFPNAFIPDDQGTNDGYYSSRSDENARVFHPVFSGVSDYNLKIFSKPGILIFESNDINIGWDGYIKGQLSSPGVYIWKVRGNFRNGEPFIKMGDVTLLKNP